MEKDLKKGDIIFYPPKDHHDRRYQLLEDPKAGDPHCKVVELEDGENEGIIVHVNISGEEKCPSQRPM